MLWSFNGSHKLYNEECTPIAKPALLEFGPQRERAVITVDDRLRLRMIGAHGLIYAKALPQDAFPVGVKPVALAAHSEFHPENLENPFAGAYVVIVRSDGMLIAIDLAMNVRWGPVALPASSRTHPLSPR